MKPKIRIQLLNNDLGVVSDRLVDQAEEIARGPTDKHEGPIRMELTALSSKEIKGIVDYLQQLSGNLPIQERQTRAYTKSKTKVNPFKEIYHSLRTKPNIEKLIEYLDELDFRFVTYQYLREQAKDKKLPFNLDELNKRLQYLILCKRIAVDPSNDKYDYTLMVGLNLFKMKDGALIYRRGKVIHTLSIKWEKGSDFNMHKKKIPEKYPDYMTIEERKKWRYLDRKYKAKKELGKSDHKFYHRHKPDIDKINDRKD